MHLNQVVCNFNMLYIGCQYQVIKKVKKERKADLPYLSFLQDEIGNTHIFFGLTGCRVHLYDNISFGNPSDRLCTQCVFFPLRNTCFRPGGVGRLFPSRTVVTLRKFSTVHFFAQMTNIVTSFSSCRLGFHTCGLSAVYTEVITEDTEAFDK